MQTLFLSYILLRLPVGIISVVLSKYPHHTSREGEETDVGDPEEKFEQRDVHVVVVTIIGQSSVRIFHQHKPQD